MTYDYVKRPACTAVVKSGKPCRRGSVLGTDRCSKHAGLSSEDVARRRAGALVVAGVDAKDFDLSTAEGCRRLLNRCVEALLADQPEPQAFVDSVTKLIRASLELFQVRESREEYDKIRAEFERVKMLREGPPVELPAHEEPTDGNG